MRVTVPFTFLTGSPTRASDAASDLSGLCCCELLLTGVRASRPTAVLIKPDFSVDPR